MKKSFLIISPEPWSHIFVSKHHYAIEIAKRGHSVWFLNPPNESVGNKIIIGKVPEHPNISVIDYSGQMKGLRYLPAFLRVYLCKKFLRRIEYITGSEIDVVWSFENSRFFDLNFAGHRLKIYHQVDLNQIFNLENAAKSADICFGTTDLICDAIRPYNSKVFKIHHGTSPDALEYLCKEEKNNNKVVATYIGNLDMAYLDLPLLSSLVENFPGITFRLIGPYSKQKDTFQALKSFNNIAWIGKVPASKIPEYLCDSDILLVLYAEQYHKDQASPHKFMEYFASGNVIVSTYTDEYKDKRHLLEMSDDQSDYLNTFEKVVEDILTYNNPELKCARKSFAKENLYSKQVDKIFSYCKLNNLQVIK